MIGGPPNPEINNRAMRFMIDANVDDAVGDIILARGMLVDYVNKSFLPGTPDSTIEDVAKIDGWIIISHDEKFLQKIQQPKFNFGDVAASGYGRIMLCTRESLQTKRFAEVFDSIQLLFDYACNSGKRMLVTIGVNWIRFDDKPLIRTERPRNRCLIHATGTPGASKD